MRRALICLMLVLAAGAVAVACDGGGSLRGSPTPAGERTPAGSPAASPTPLSPAPFRPEPGEATPAASVDLASVSPVVTILAADAGDFLAGIASLATGDFNDDGVADLLIGMPFADGPDNGREDAGEAFAIFGRDGLSGEIDLAKEEADLHILGALPGDTLGFGVAAGDINGDGVDDVIVGAPGSNGAGNERTDLGEAYVVFGSSDLGGTVDIAVTEQDFTVVAAEGYARLGTSFAVADVNADGVDDLVAGAPFAGREPGSPVGGRRTTVGEVYVVLGSANLRGTVSVALDQQDLILAGSKQLDAFGQAVAAGDVNGDQVPDIIVSARGFDGPDGDRMDAGAVFVFFGSSRLPGKLSIDEADLTFLGADPQDGLGEKIDWGDLDGDDVADIVVVAKSGDGPDNGRSNSGEAHVFFGGPSIGALDLATDEADSVIYGPRSSGLMGTALAVTDLDGDRRDDVVLGAALASGGERSLNGMVYITFGDALPGQLDLSLAGELFLYGAFEHDALGSSIVVADINADGRPELIVGAAGSQAPGGGMTRVLAVPLP